MNIGILGAGIWGVALAKLLCNARHCISVWTTSEEKAITFSSTHKYPNLENMIIPDGIKFTSKISEVCTDKKLWYLLLLRYTLGKRQKSCLLY